MTTYQLDSTQISNALAAYLIADGRIESIKEVNITFSTEDVTASVQIVRQK